MLKLLLQREYRTQKCNDICSLTLDQYSTHINLEFVCDFDCKWMCPTMFYYCSKRFILKIKCTLFLCFANLYAAIRGYALSYLSSCAGRIRYLLNTPGMVALDLDSSLKGLFQQIVQQLENIPKPQGENVSAITCDLSVRNLQTMLYFL